MEYNPDTIPDEEILKMATVNGAHAMGLKDADVLAEGKIADIVVFDPNVEYTIDKNTFFSKGKISLTFRVLFNEKTY